MGKVTGFTSHTYARVRRSKARICWMATLFRTISRDSLLKSDIGTYLLRRAGILFSKFILYAKKSRSVALYVSIKQWKQRRNRIEVEVDLLSGVQHLIAVSHQVHVLFESIHLGCHYFPVCILYRSHLFLKVMQFV